MTTDENLRRYRTARLNSDLASIQELIELAHNPELAEAHGHVFQIWDDAEITMQKSGELLWHRTLHRYIGGIDGLKLKMPCERGVHSFAFVTKDDAIEIARQVVNLLTRHPQIDIEPHEVARYNIWVRPGNEAAA